MARVYDDDYSGSSHFVTSRDVGGVKREIVYGAPVKIHRAASQSMGKDVSVEWLDRNAVEDWTPSEKELSGIGNSKASGFARYAELYGDVYEDQGRFPVENIFPSSGGFLDSLTELERQRIVEAADPSTSLPDPRRRIHRDPVSRVPENFAAIDRTSESDRFYGKDKVSETDVVLERMKHVDRGRERVDYRVSKAVPIKIVRGS